MSSQELLKKLYYDPKTVFIGTQALYQKAKELDPKITIKIVKEWYANQTDIQRFQDQKKRFDGFKIASHNPNSWQMDLAFWEKRPILTAININSRLGYAKLLSNKTAATVLAALKAFVLLHTVDILTSDNGSEFMNSQAQQFFQSKNMDHYNNEPGDHGTMGKIERFNRTLKQRLTKMSPKRITQKLISDVIETIIARSIDLLK
ncbi:Pol polyprotein [Phytophthora citrophthora]|uniref:Pol polyprotein n=1 Tax=Phytophthora citrophthora TaxID=4793 RepID=A0AAD9G852_9STRA|nr:Pol polyprotein [Phytophthora citrophthora]